MQFIQEISDYYLLFKVVPAQILQISMKSFDFKKLGNVSLKAAVENSRYPPAFSYKVIHNGLRKDQLKKCYVSFKLSRTEPTVEISVDAGTHGMSSCVESHSFILILYVYTVSCYLHFFTII